MYNCIYIYTFFLYMNNISQQSLSPVQYLASCRFIPNGASTPFRKDVLLSEQGKGWTWRSARPTTWAKEGSLSCWVWGYRLIGGGETPPQIVVICCSNGSSNDREPRGVSGDLETDAMWKMPSSILGGCPAGPSVSHRILLNLPWFGEVPQACADLGRVSGWRRVGMNGVDTVEVWREKRTGLVPTPQLLSGWFMESFCVVILVAFS